MEHTHRFQDPHRPITRRKFLLRMGQCSSGLVLASMVGSLHTCSQNRTNSPNMILFLADDAGWHDVGYHGSKIRTPNIDRLARTGVVLDQFYAYPSCSPTRAALLTGRPPSRFGVHSPLGGNEHLRLPAGFHTLPDLLGSSHYQTAICGKWHLGMTIDYEPRRYGFDYSYGSLRGQIDQYTHHYKYGQRTWQRNGQLVDEPGHATDLIAQEAMKYIRSIRDKSRPFFLYIPFTVPHYPVQEPEEWVRPYEEIFPDWSRRVYAASMTHMDDAIGRVITVMQEEGLEQETLVMFVSDNGGQQSWNSPIDQYNGKFRPNDHLGNNAPLRGWKTQLYEGGIRVPAVFSWPGVVGQETVSEPMIIYDLAPTLVELSGGTVPDGMSMEGINVWPAITGKATLPERILYWRTPQGFALRRGPWKLIHHGKTLSEGTTELYNLQDDPTETSNVSATHPQVLTSLLQALQQQITLDEKSQHSLEM